MTEPASISPSARLLGDTVAWALTMNVVGEAEVWIAPPGGRAGGVLQPPLHFLGLGAWSSFEQQRHGAGDVGRRHRRATDGSVSTLFERQRRPDEAARRADVRLEAEIGRQAVRREARDQATGRVWLARDGRRPRHG